MLGIRPISKYISVGRTSAVHRRISELDLPEERLANDLSANSMSRSEVEHAMTALEEDVDDTLAEHKMAHIKNVRHYAHCTSQVIEMSAIRLTNIFKIIIETLSLASVFNNSNNIWRIFISKDQSECP
ncbi:hypothetical protein AVEN_206865-1 [Araneus ventricosus]|uniref:Uncharacterized protein n=1 Tax=Araneus ventricosus TaxID=182803 RepID=A0A4Y2V8J2_ARAVE|nr:hypothetical protein AVEN_206865-1 [Araneus ventricosus]